MKKYLCILLVVAACNSTENKNGSTNKAGTETKEAVAEKAPVSGACSKLVYFQTGVEVETTTYDAAGKAISIQHAKVIDVKNDNGITTASVESEDIKAAGGTAKKMSYSYHCDGNKIYFDIAAMFRAEVKEKDASFKASVIEYPINISTGETLPDASGTMSTEKDGKVTTMTYHYKNRKVEAQEDIKTTAGSWNCFKISNAIEIDLDFPGMDEETKKIMQSMRARNKTTTTTWFAPDFGVVKMEMYQNGNLQTRVQVTGVKK